MYTRKSLVCSAVVLCLVAVSAGPALAQEEGGPPMIMSAKFVADPDCNLPMLETCNSTADMLLELDTIYICITVFDPDFVTIDPNDPNAVPEESDEELFIGVGSIWWPYISGGVVYGPEPPPVSTDDVNFTAYGPITGGDPATGEVTVILPFVVPRFNGENQAKLRGFIGYDVQWLVEVSAKDSNDDVAWWTFVNDGMSIIPVCALSNPALDPPNPPPFAAAGGDRVVGVGTQVKLDATRTFDAVNVGFDALDPEIYAKDELQYAWEWISGPEQVDPVADPRNPAISYFTPNIEGDYVYRVTVSDGVNAFPTSDNVTITAVDPATLAENSTPPRAIVIGPDTPVLVGNTITLDGTRSSDAEGDPITFRWRQTNELGGELAADEVQDAFQPLSGLTDGTSTWQATRPGTYYFRLLVSDPFGNTDSEMVSVEVIDGATAGFRVVNCGDCTPNQLDESSPTDNGPTTVAPFTAACGTSLMPLLVVPMVLWVARGRMR